MVRTGTFVPIWILDGALEMEFLTIVILRWLGVTGWVKGRWISKRPEPVDEATAYPAGGGLAMFFAELRFDVFSSFDALISINDLRLSGPLVVLFEAPAPVPVPCPPAAFSFVAAAV